MSPSKQEPQGGIQKESNSFVLEGIENVLFFAVRLILLLVLIATWFVLGGVYAAWVIFRTSIAYTFSILAGLLHGGRDYAGSVAALRPAVNMWPHGFYQIFQALDPRKKPTEGEGLPFKWSRVLFESACAFLFITMVIGGEVLVLAASGKIDTAWRTFRGESATKVLKAEDSSKDEALREEQSKVRSKDAALSELQSKFQMLTAEKQAADNSLKKAQEELNQRILWRATRVSTHLVAPVSFDLWADNVWERQNLKPGYHIDFLLRNSEVRVRFRRTPSSDYTEMTLKSTLFDEEPTDSERNGAPNCYFWLTKNGEINLPCN